MVATERRAGGGARRLWVGMERGGGERNWGEHEHEENEGNSLDRTVEAEELRGGLAAREGGVAGLAWWWRSGGRGIKSVMGRDWGR